MAEQQADQEQPFDRWRARPDLSSSDGSLRIGVIADLHLGADGGAGPLGFSKQFLDDRPMQQDLDLLVLNGDVNGKAMDSYPLVEDLFTKLHSINYYLSGNTDARTPETLKKYFEISRRPLDSVLWMKGIRLVFLGVEQYGHEISIASERIRWLASQLTQSEATTLIFHHLPLADTTYNSGDLIQFFPDVYPFNTRVPRDDSQEIRLLLECNPQVKLWVSGHTHPHHRAVDRLGRGTTFRDENCLHLAVTNLGYKKPTPEGRVLFVEPNRILIRTRNFAKKAWQDDLSYEVPGKTSLET